MNLELVQKCYNDFLSIRGHYNKINRYYYGNTDSLKNFKPMEGRSNLIVKTNFVQKLVDEEAQYSFANDVTYTSVDGNTEVIKDIAYNLANNDEDHDINLGIELVKYGIGYEVSYMVEDKPKEFSFHNMIVSALDGYAYIEDNEIVYFLRSFRKQLDETNYIDVYTKEGVYHYNDSWSEVEPMTPNYFGFVPVGIGIIGGVQYNTKRGYKEGNKTIYDTIKDIQDAYETNWSDMVSEISDFRNAIMKLYGVKTETKKDEEGKEILDSNGNPIKETPVIRDNCILAFEDKSTQDAEWLIKNINDTFIKNTRDDLKDLIYTLTSHVDTNEKMQSNLSGIALRSRLQSLESKCAMNEKAMINILKTRLKCLFRFLDLTQSKQFDVNTIKIKFTPKVPQDITSIADVISKIPHEVLSNKSKREMLPNINNSDSEQDQIDKELKAAEPQVNLDNITHTGGGIDE